MTQIVTRSGKGSALTITELDANFTNLNGDKVEATRVVGTTTGELVGGGSLNVDRTIGLADSGVSAGTINNSASQTTPISIDAKGRITNTGTPVVIAPAFSSVSSKPTTLSGYGITDAQGTISGAASTITSANLTASKALASDTTGKVVVSGTSSTELGYLTGVTSAIQNQLDGKQGTSGKDQANGYAGLSASGKLSDAVIPDLAIVQYLGTAANQTAMLALKDPADGVSAPQSGDWCLRSDDGKVYLVTGSPSTSGGWTALGYPTAPVLSVNGYTGSVSLTKTDLQLGNVSNDAQLKIASNLADLNNAVTARTNLGVAIGTNVQGWDADLDAIAALSGTSGFAKKTAANTWSLDTSTYITGNQTISVTGDATGSGSTTITVTLAGSGATAGTYKSVAVNAKGLITGGTNPTTFSGYGISDTSANLAASLTDETGSGSAVFATSPTLVTPTLGVASATTVNKVTLTTPATGSTLTIADGKTLTASNTLTFTGTDASSVAFGTGGTVVFSGGALGTPSSGTLTTCTGLPISTGVSGLGVNVSTFLITPNSANLVSALIDKTGTGSAVFATSPTLVTPILGTPTSGTLTSCTGLPLSTGVTGTLPVLNGGTGVTTSTGSGNNVLGTSPTLVTPILGTPTSGTLTSCSGLPISSGVSGLATGVATFLGSASSANLLAALTDKTGSGLAVFNVNPTFTNYTETFYTITYASTFTLSLANGTMQTVSLGGSPTITMPTAVAGKSFTLIINTNAGGNTVSWSTVAWAGGTTPTVTTTGSKKDIFNFYSDGTLWYGSTFGQSF